MKSSPWSKRRLGNSIGHPLGQQLWGRYLLLYVADSRSLSERLSLYLSTASLWFPFFTSSLPSSFRTLALSTSSVEGTRYKYIRGKNHGAGAQLRPKKSLWHHLFQVVYNLLSPENPYTVVKHPLMINEFPINGFWEIKQLFIQKLGTPGKHTYTCT